MNKKFAIEKISSYIGKIFENNNDILIIDTETTGINPENSDIIQLAGILFNIEKILTIKENKNEIYLGLNNKYFENIKFEEKIKESLYKLNDDEYLIIKNNIPLIYKEKTKKYKMIFPVIGDIKIKETVEKKYDYEKFNQGMLNALKVHHIYDSKKLKNFLKSSNINLKEEINNLLKKEEKELEKLEKEYIKKLEDLEKLNNFNEIKQKEKEKLKIIKNKIEKIRNFKKKKNYDIDEFLHLLKSLDFIEVNNLKLFREDKEIINKLKEKFNDNKTIIAGHNFFMFDFYKFLKQHTGDITNLILDTLIEYNEITKQKNSISLDKLTDKVINEKVSFYKKQLKKYSKNLTKEQKELINNIILKGIYNQEVEKHILNLPKEIKVLTEDIASLIKLKEERKFRHDALLDIKINIFAVEGLLKEYIERYGLKDIFAEYKVKKHEIDRNMNIKELPLLGVKTSISKNSISNIDEIIEYLKKNNINEIIISDDIFTDVYKNIEKLKENNIKTTLSFKVSIKDFENLKNNEIDLVFKDKKSFENAKLLIKDYQIKLEDLIYLLDKYKVNGIIHPNLDKYLKHEKLYVKYSPNIIWDYSKSKFQNKGIFWLENEYIENTVDNKIAHFIYNKMEDNQKISPVKLYQLDINKGRNIRNLGLITTKELMQIFPFETYKEVYQNTEKIMEDIEEFNPMPEHIEPFPAIERLISKEYLQKANLNKYPEKPEEFKNLLKAMLREDWKNKFSTVSNIEAVYKTLEKIKRDNIEEWKIFNIKSIDLLPKNKFFNVKDIENFIDNRVNDNNLKEKFMKIFKKTKEEIKKQIQERVEFELNSISKFPNYKIVFKYYFLIKKILSDFEKNGIIHGPGRGSAAGSIISYILGVTKVNPIKYGLLFERFLNPERITMPDIDGDFIGNRDDLIKILNQTFNLTDEEIFTFLKRLGFYDTETIHRMLKNNYQEYISRIRTVSYLTDKVIFNNLLRLGLTTPFNIVKEISKYYEEEKSILKNFNDNPILKNENEFFINFFNKNNKSLEKLKDLPIRFGIHAGGVLIPYVIMNVEELIKNGVTSTDKRNPRNEAKMDLLGLITLDIINEIRIQIKNLLKQNINLSEKQKEIYNRLLENEYFFVYDDPEVYKLIRRGLNASVFQIENKKLGKLLNRLVTDDFETLISAIALYRPGPLMTGDVEKYIFFRLNKLKKELIEELSNNKNFVTDFKKIYHKDFSTKNLEEILSTDNNVDSLKKLILKYTNYKDRYETLDDLNNVLYVGNYYSSETYKSKIYNKIKELRNFINENKYLINNKEELIKKYKMSLKLEKLLQIEKSYIDFLFENNKNNFDIEEKTKLFVEYIKNFEKDIENDLDYKEITETTNGVIVYQEQIMLLARVLGFTKGEADALRKVIAKSQKEKIEEFRDRIVKQLTKDRLINLRGKFGEQNFEIYRNNEYDYIIKINNKEYNVYSLTGFEIKDNKLILELNPKQIELIDKKLLENFEIKDNKLIINNIKINDKKIVKGHSLEVSNYFFDNIVGFGSYAFNKSHAAAYATLTYFTAMFKRYAPEIFYSVNLKYSTGKQIQELIREIKTKFEDFFGFKIKLDYNLDVNKLNPDFKFDIIKHEINFPASIIKSTKEESIEYIFHEKNLNKSYFKSIKYKTLIDFYIRTLIDKQTFKQLSITGIFNTLISSKYRNNFTIKLWHKFGDEIFETVKKYFEELLKNNFSSKEKQLIKKYLKEIKYKNLIQIYKSKINEFKKDINTAKEIYNYEEAQEKEFFIKEEIADLEDKINKLEQKIENLEIPKEIWHKFLNILPSTLEENFIKMIENEIKDEEKLNEFKKIINNKEEYEENQLNNLKYQIFKDYYFMDKTVELKNINKTVLDNFIKSYYSAENNNNTIFIGKNPKIVVLIKDVLKDKYPSEITIKKDGNKIFTYKKVKKEFEKEGQIIKYDAYETVLDNGKKEFKSAKRFIEEINSNNVEIVNMKYSTDDIYKKFLLNIFINANQYLNFDDFVVIPYKKGIVEKIITELSPSLLLVSGADAIKETKLNSNIYGKISENNTEYHVQIYPYQIKGNTSNVIFFENIANIKRFLNSVKDYRVKEEIKAKINKFNEEISRSLGQIKKSDNILENDFQISTTN